MSYEIRAMSFGEILDMGFRLLRNHFALLVGLAAVMYLPLQLATMALQGSVGQVPSPAEVAALAVVSVLVAMIAGQIVSAASTYALGELYVGREIAFGGALRFAVGIFLPLIGTSFLASLAWLGGVAVPAGVVLGAGWLAGLASSAPFLAVVGIGAAAAAVYLGLAILLVAQVIAIERRFGLVALGRSFDLMRGHKVRAFGIMLLVSILNAVLQAAFALVTFAIPFALVGALAQALAQSVGYAFMAAVLVVFYFDIRCRVEAFDLEHLASLVETQGEGPAPARMPEAPVG